MEKQRQKQHWILFFQILSIYIYIYIYIDENFKMSTFFQCTNKLSLNFGVLSTCIRGLLHGNFLKKLENNEEVICT